MILGTDLEVLSPGPSPTQIERQLVDVRAERESWRAIRSLTSQTGEYYDSLVCSTRISKREGPAILGVIWKIPLFPTAPARPFAERSRRAVYHPVVLTQPA